MKNSIFILLLSHVIALTFAFEFSMQLTYNETWSKTNFDFEFTMGNIFDKNDGRPYRQQNIIAKTVFAKNSWSLTDLH